MVASVKEDVAEFIDTKVTPRPLADSLPRSEVLYRYFDMHSAGDKNVTEAVTTTAQLTEKQ